MHSKANVLLNRDYKLLTIIIKWKQLQSSNPRWNKAKDSDANDVDLYKMNQLLISLFKEMMHHLETH